MILRSASRGNCTCVVLLSDYSVLLGEERSAASIDSSVPLRNHGDACL